MICEREGLYYSCFDVDSLVSCRMIKYYDYLRLYTFHTDARFIQALHKRLECFKLSIE
jgi:hypothetical protein